MNRRGDYLLFMSDEEIKRQAALHVARLVVIVFSIGLVVALVISVVSK